MYFGSVRFYKHFILLVTVAVIFILLGGIVVLNHRNHDLQKALEDGAVKAQADATWLAVSNASLIKGYQQQYNMSYQTDYPDLYSIRPSSLKRVEGKAVYLTFDDGPSDRTLEILDILDRYQVKATFFVIYQNDEKSKRIYQEIVDRGHTIAVHSASHKYSKIYTSVDAFLKDFRIIYTQITTVTGVKPQIFRFPGGSINPYNVDIYQQLVAEMLRRGFVYFDWNVSGGDSDPDITSEEIIETVENNVSKYDKSIVLLHDSETKYATVDALGSIIRDLQDSGYTFHKLDKSVPAVNFAYKINY